jgi:phasin family protein
MSQKPKAGVRPRIAPVVKAMPLEPVAKVESVEVEPIAESVASPIETADELIVAPVEAVAAPVEPVAEPIPAVEDPVPAVTVEAVATAPATKPTQPTPTQGIKTMMKTTEEFVAFGQANMEALVKSGQIWSTGVQELTKQFASTAKASFDESVSTFKAISTVKSVKEALELQSAFAKTAFEKAVAESKQITDASIKLTEATLAPITARVTVAVETFSKAA